MTDYKRITLSTESPEESCDIRIWSAECKQSDYATKGDKYLCGSCGKILKLDHEMHHEIFPHVSGDADFLY